LIRSLTPGEPQLSFLVLLAAQQRNGRANAPLQIHLALAMLNTVMVITLNDNLIDSEHNAPKTFWVESARRTITGVRLPHIPVVSLRDLDISLCKLDLHVPKLPTTPFPRLNQSEGAKTARAKKRAGLSRCAG
jgi:hypothetical protein